jgi:hypothetical protein
MKYVRVAAATLALAATAALMLVPAASAITLPQSLTLKLSSPHATFNGRLTGGRWYILTAAGTGSYFKPGMWTHPLLRHHKPGIVCGTPEAAPMFPTTGATGKVGVDPETMFARLTTRRLCRNDPLPRTSRRFQINNGSGYRHPTTLTGRYTIPRRDHTYSYAIHGLGRRVSVRVRDNIASDNYGAFHLTLRLAVPADCAARQWRNFYNSAGNMMFVSQAACEAGVG